MQCTRCVHACLKFGSRSPLKATPPAFSRMLPGVLLLRSCEPVARLLSVAPCCAVLGWAVLSGRAVQRAVQRAVPRFSNYFRSYVRCCFVSPVGFDAEAPCSVPQPATKQLLLSIEVSSPDDMFGGASQHNRNISENERSELMRAPTAERVCVDRFQRSSISDAKPPCNVQVRARPGFPVSEGTFRV